MRNRVSQMSFDLGDLRSPASLCDVLLETGHKDWFSYITAVTDGNENKCDMPDKERSLIVTVKLAVNCNIH